MRPEIVGVAHSLKFVLQFALSILLLALGHNVWTLIAGTTLFIDSFMFSMCTFWFTPIKVVYYISLGTWITIWSGVGFSVTNGSLVFLIMFGVFYGLSMLVTGLLQAAAKYARGPGAGSTPQSPRDGLQYEGLPDEPQSPLELPA